MFNHSINSLNEELKHLGFKLNNKADVEFVLEVLYELNISVEEFIKSKFSNLLEKT